MLHLDTSAASAKTLSPSLGIPDQELSALRTPLKRHIESMIEERKAGKHAWAMLPYNRRMREKIKECAASIRRKKPQTIIWIGIGGSALTTQIIQDMFERPDGVEFIVVDTMDPYALQTLLHMVDWSNTFVIAASKSGETLETLSAFFLCFEKLTEAHGKKARSWALAITDIRSGELRAYSSKHDIDILSFPADVGGRFSAFTAMGLLPLELLGEDSNDFCKGAKDMDDRCQGTNLQENPAALLAATQYLLEHKRGYKQRIIMPYGTRMKHIARWNQQLIAESLGKDELHNPLPVVAEGTQDQHSLLQQWMQGPRLSWHLFLRDIEKPRVFVPENIPENFSHIAGKSFGQLMDAALDGTAMALTTAKRRI